MFRPSCSRQMATGKSLGKVMDTSPQRQPPWMVDMVLELGVYNRQVQKQCEFSGNDVAVTSPGANAGKE